MTKIPNLDELLNYDEEYKYPDLIMSDYFSVDNTRKKDNKQGNKQPQEQSSEQQSDEQTEEQGSEQQSDEQTQEQVSEQQSNEQTQEQSSEQQSNEQTQEQSSEQQSNEQTEEQSSEQQSDEQTQEQSSEQQSNEQTQEQSSEQQSNEQTEEQSSEQQRDEQKQEQSSEQPSNEQTEEQSSEQPSNEQTEEQSSEQQSNEQTQEQSSEQPSNEQTEEQSSEQPSNEQTEEQNSGQQSDEETQEQRTEQQSDENDFENLMNNYEEDVVKENDNNENQGTQSPSDKLNDITTTKIYSVLKKLVSLSYDRYQKGTYKYDKKEIVKHYLTNQKFKILDDLVSPTFKPDVYVFDLSPSNNESLEMYVNAISSVAIKNSLIYLTYNDCILRKLIIKKGSSKPIDVSKIATSQLQKYNNFDCVIFNEYRSLYEELREIKDRKIYIFSDFDISSDISKLSQENQDIVWFSTEKSNYGSSIYQSFFYREYPTSYAGYYVETSGIEDIEKYIMEKNKAKYKRRSM